jgi:hypothetical protein
LPAALRFGILSDHANDMSRALDEFFAGVEEEFGVGFGGVDEDTFQTPGQVIDYVAEQTSPSDGMTEDEHRDHVASVVGEIMAQALGVTRYTEDSRFLEDLHVR